MTDTNFTTSNVHLPASFAVGSTVFDKYIIEEFISSGAKGRVYKVKDIVLDKVVALKVLGVESDQQRDIVRFQSEARMASRLKHPNIATVLDFGLSNSTPYLTMEYVEGTTLRSLLDAATTLDLGDFCEIFSQVCYALDYAHIHGIVHRDIKPVNIMVSDRVDDGGLRVKVLDFGVAKLVDNIACIDGRLTPSGRIVGSPCYMSPEQSRGRHVTQKSDNYSLGCLMWECLTGEPPFVGESVMETLLLQQNASPGRLKELVAVEIPDDLADVVEALLAKLPEERPGLKSKVVPIVEQLFEKCNAVKVVERVEEAPPRVKSWKIPRSWILIGVMIGLIVIMGVLWKANSNIWFPPTTNHESITSVIDDTVDFAALQRFEDIKNIQSHEGYFKLNGLTNDDHLKVLVNNKSLTLLDISETDVTNKALQVVATLPNLVALRANWTQINRLDGLERLPHLQALEIKGTNINDEGLKPIVGSKLRVLDLGSSSISNRALADITRIKTLRELRLGGVKSISFESLDQLRELPELSSVDFYNTSIKPANVRKVISLCPKLKTIKIENCPNISLGELKKLEEDFPHFVFSGNLSFVDSKSLRIVQESERHHFSEALRLQTDLIHFLERRGGHDDRVFTMYLSNANLCVHGGSLKEAWYWLGKAKRFAASTGDPKQEVDVNEVSNTIELVAAHGELSKALMNRHLKNFARAEQVYKDDHFAVTLKLRVLADTLKSCGYRLEAWRYFIRALDNFKKWKTDPKSPEYMVLGTIYVHMGEFLREEQKYSKAIVYFEDGLKILESFGPPYEGNALIVANGYAGYAVCELALGENQRALRLSTKAVSIVDKLHLFGSCKKFVYYDHAIVLRSVGRNVEAQRYLDESNKMYVKLKLGGEPQR